jgi:hypothetical protein
MSFLFLSISQGQTAVQRSAGSSYFEYQKYLQQSKNRSFVRSYLEMTRAIEPDTALVHQCLEGLFVGKQSEEICFDAVKSMNSQPLNSTSREILFSLLKKIEKFSSKYQTIYIELKKGFSLTHPQLAKSLGSFRQQELPAQAFSKLEMKAWKKMIERKMMLSESVLLINGEVIQDMSSWSPPSGVFQWALISNTHEPLIKISSFSQFAAESIQTLKSFSNQSCENSEKKELKTFGLKQVQIFYSKKCILEKPLLASESKPDHLGDLPTSVKIIPPSSKSHWLFPALTILGLGIASQLKGKSVSLTMPGF